MDNMIQEFWNAFQKDYGQSNLTYIEAFAFGSGGFMADRLLALVLQGKKTATCSSKAAWGNAPLPRPGDLSIVLDGRGQARCVIETQSVHFKKICRWFLKPLRQSISNQKTRSLLITNENWGFAGQFTGQ